MVEVSIDGLMEEIMLENLKMVRSAVKARMFTKMERNILDSISIINSTEKEELYILMAKKKKEFGILESWSLC